MRVVVDYSLCESNALCVGAAPEVFAMSDDDTLLVLDEEPGRGVAGQGRGCRAGVPEAGDHDRRVMTPLVEREVREDVAEVLVRYATGIDRRDWAQFRSCFTDDCEADYGEIGVWHGADEISAFMEQSHAACGHHDASHHQPGSDTDRQRCVGAQLRGCDRPRADNVNGARAIGYYDDELPTPRAGGRSPGAPSRW